MGSEANWGSIIVFAVLCLVGWLGSSLMCNKIAKEKGLDLTGKFLKKIPMIIGGIGALMLLLTIFSEGEDMLFPELSMSLNIIISIALFLIGTAILFLMNKKIDNIGTAVVLSVLQSMSGLAMIVVFIFKLISFGLNIQSGNSKKITTQTNYEREVQKQGAYNINSATDQQKDVAAQKIGYKDHKEVDKVLKGEE